MKITRLNEAVDKKHSRIVESEDPTVRETDGGATIEADVKLTPSGEPGTEKDALKVQNALTDILDRALDDARFALSEDNFDANCNVLITGLPGSSKTATVRNWCKANGCNLYYLDAKNPDLQLLTSGASAIDRTDPAHPKVNTAYSNALAKLDRPNSVLFLDELNRQIKEYLRGSLYTLLADRRVAGEDEEGFRYFPNLLFTIAAINPPVDGDRGASKLSSAERRRFYYSVEFNSEVPTTRSFIRSYYDKKITKYVEARKGALTPADIERINSFCLRQWLGLKIINDEDFHYTTVAEYKATASTEESQITCQSTITELIDHSRGDVERLVRDIKAGDLNAAGKDMLIKIINRLVLPNVDALRANKAKELGLDLGATVDVPAVDTAADVTAEDDDAMPADFLSGREDDADFRDDGTTVGSGTIDAEKAKEAAVSDAAITSRLTDFASKW